jgi:hypothetical protein
MRHDGSIGEPETGPDLGDNGAGRPGQDRPVRMLDPLIDALDRALARRRAQTPDPVDTGA